MNDLMWFVITLFVGAVGSALATKYRVPVGGIIGAMAAVVLLNLVTGGKAVFYESVKVLVQLTVGTVSGSRIGKNDIKEMRMIIIPMIIIFPMFLVYNLIFGTAIYSTSSLDVFTSFYSLSPGSIADIAIVAGELGADTAVVGLIHALRVIICSVVMPPLFCAVLKKRGDSLPQSAESTAMTAAEQKSFFFILLQFALSFLGGIWMKNLGVKGGAIIGAMIVSMLFTCAFGKTQMPKWVKRYQQALVGTYVGAEITMATLVGIKGLLLPIGLLLISIVVGTFFSTWLVMKTKKLDPVSALTCCAPGGMTEMLILTDELGGDMPKVAVVHSLRIFFVIAVFPTVINWFVSAFSL